MSLLSGRTALIETKLDVDFETIQQHAQNALKVGHGRLFDSCGLALEGPRSIRDCGLQTGDALTLHLQPVAILANLHQHNFNVGEFVAILGDGSVVTWGHIDNGGDNITVQHRLRNVQQIQASHKAFAAILGDGSVVT